MSQFIGHRFDSIVFWQVTQRACEVKRTMFPANQAKNLP